MNILDATRLIIERALGRVNEWNQIWSASRMNFILVSMIGRIRDRMTNRARDSIPELRNSAARWIYTNYLNIRANRHPALGAEPRRDRFYDR